MSNYNPMLELKSLRDDVGVFNRKNSHVATATVRETAHHLILGFSWANQRFEDRETRVYYFKKPEREIVFNGCVAAFRREMRSIERHFGGAA